MRKSTVHRHGYTLVIQQGDDVHNFSFITRIFIHQREMLSGCYGCYLPSIKTTHRALINQANKVHVTPLPSWYDMWDVITPEDPAFVWKVGWLARRWSVRWPRSRWSRLGAKPHKLSAISYVHILKHINVYITWFALWVFIHAQTVSTHLTFFF